MDAVVEQLVEKKSLTKQEFFQLVELNGSINPMPRSILDIRAAKLSAFREASAVDQKETNGAVTPQKGRHPRSLMFSYSIFSL